MSIADRGSLRASGSYGSQGTEWRSQQARPVRVRDVQYPRLSAPSFSHPVLSMHVCILACNACNTILHAWRLFMELTNFNRAGVRDVSPTRGQDYYDPYASNYSQYGQRSS